MSNFTITSTTGYNFKFSGTYYTVYKIGCNGKDEVILKTKDWAAAHLLFDYLTEGYDINDKEQFTKMLGKYFQKISKLLLNM